MLVANRSRRGNEQADQSYLPAIITGCKSVLKQFPLRGREQTPGKDMG